MTTDDKLRAELDAARAEITELRQAVVAVCDTYSANRSEKQKVKAYRLVAAKGPYPFSMAAVEAELTRIENRDRDRDEQLAVDLDEALAMIEKTPGIDVAIKAIRYVRDVLDPGPK